MQKWLTYSFVLVLSLLFLGSCKNQKRATSKRPKTETRHHAHLKEKYADALNVPTSSIRNTTLYAFVDEWQGVPYKYGGMNKSGVDCSGFTGLLYDSVYDKKLPRTTSEISKVSKTVKQKDLQEGDIIFFDINGKKGSHIGVYLMNDFFVHASSSKGVVISNLSNPYYKKAYGRAGR